MSTVTIAEVIASGELLVKFMVMTSIAVMVTVRGFAYISQIMKGKELEGDRDE